MVAPELEAPILSFSPEESAEGYFRSLRGPLAHGTFEPVGSTATAADEGEWHMESNLVDNGTRRSGPLDAQLAQGLGAGCSFELTVAGPLPFVPVRSEEANQIKEIIGGDSANLTLRDTLAAVTVANKLGMPVVLSGKGLLAGTTELVRAEYAVSTLGSRSSDGNFIHALVVSPVLSLEEILACEMGATWLASIIRKEQLLVSYRPIRGLQKCEDLDVRAKSMPIDAASIISKQRGIEIRSELRNLTDHV